MAAYSGPNKVSDSLFFYYDAANIRKSNIGKPVENLLRSTNNAVNTFHQSRNPRSGTGHGSTAVSTEISPPVSGATVYRVDENGVDNQNVRWSIRLNADTFLQYNQKYTFSSWVYLPSQYAGRYTGSTIELYQNTNGNDWHSTRGFNSQFNFYGAGSIRTATLVPDINLLDTWQRMAVTFEPLSANVNLPENNGNDNNIWAAGFFRINVSGAVNGGTPYHLYISDAQLETGEIISDFVLEERTKSQSKVDMTGRIPITVENLEYTSNNKFRFNGTSSYIDLSNSQWPDLFRSDTGRDFTIEVWMKPENIGTNQAIFGQRHGDALSLHLMQNGKVTFEMDDTNTRIGTNTVLQNNQWYQIVIVFENDDANSLCSYFVNGKFERSEAKWDGNGIIGPINCWIGWQSRTNYSINPGYFNGEIDIVKVYNRLLTANEVAQNFEALRDRYEI